MIIGITGITGFVGAHVAEQAKAQGHEVVGFSRRPHGSMRMMPSVLMPDLPDLSGLDAVVNLAGESIMGLWTSQKKWRIRESRIQGTRKIVEAIKATPNPPKVLINASAIGFYGETGERIADETSAPGSGLLAEVCEAWEAEAMSLEKSGVRVVCLRIGFVIGPGGALKMIRPIFSLGLGGNLGNGRQWMSCVHVDDVAGLCLWALQKDTLHGPVNAVMPEPVRNADFTREMAAAVHRPAFLPAPAPLIKLATGDLSHLFLDSIRVVPAVALSQGYQFRYPRLADALKASV